MASAVRFDLFHATDFGCSEHSEDKVYEVYTRSLLSWSGMPGLSGWSR